MIANRETFQKLDGAFLCACHAGQMTNRAEMQERAQGYTIGGVRILAGLMWLANLHWKVPTDFGENNGGGLYKYVAAGAQNAPLAPYRWALRELVLPNFQAFGWFSIEEEKLRVVSNTRNPRTALHGHIHELKSHSRLRAMEQ